MDEQKNLEDEVSDFIANRRSIRDTEGKKVQRERRFMPGYVL